MERFSVSAGVREGLQVLVVRGELDELTAPELDREIDGHRFGWPVIVDLSDVQFMSSAGLHVLLRNRPEKVALVCPPGNIRRVLEIVRADTRVPIFSDLDAAAQSLTLTQGARDRVGSESGAGSAVHEQSVQRPE
ncbi:MAG TPA: STAS domain-containing protein [Gaiellaceae bacterium]|nr:STAS domain-containing protein [Gaiellaceae bacterium]